MWVGVWVGLVRNKANVSLARASQFGLSLAKRKKELKKDARKLKKNETKSTIKLEPEHKVEEREPERKESEQPVVEEEKCNVMVAAIEPTLKLEDTFGGEVEDGDPQVKGKVKNPRLRRKLIM